MYQPSKAKAVSESQDLEPARHERFFCSGSSLLTTPPGLPTLKSTQLCARTQQGVSTKTEAPETLSSRSSQICFCSPPSLRQILERGQNTPGSDHCQEHRSHPGRPSRALPFSVNLLWTCHGRHAQLLAPSRGAAQSCKAKPQQAQFRGQGSARGQPCAPLPKPGLTRPILLRDLGVWRCREMLALPWLCQGRFQGDALQTQQFCLASDGFWASSRPLGCREPH